jgi:integrase
VKSYRLGVVDFSRWLEREGRGLGDITRRDVEDYISQFADGADRIGGARRAPRTVNHRLSALSAFFAYLIGRDTQDGGAWANQPNPVPQPVPVQGRGIGGGGSPLPRRTRAELRRREPSELPRVIGRDRISALIDAAGSFRDKAILTLLSQSGQRIGDWSDQHGRHGVLGMGLADLDRRSSTIVVRLKGARDEHRVPVTAAFWEMFDRYLSLERRGAPGEAAWVGLRRGWPKPLAYSAFEAALRALGAKTGIEVTAHMFRHTVASEVLGAAGVAVAQELLGHQHVSTTVDTYGHIGADALVAAVAGVEQEAVRAGVPLGDQAFAFHYDPSTLAELEAATRPPHRGPASA